MQNLKIENKFLINEKTNKKTEQKYEIQDLKKNYKIGIKYYEDVEEKNKKT